MAVPMKEPGRQAAHVLLDVVAAWDDEDQDGWGPRANLAIQRLNDVGALTAKFDDETDILDLDASDLLGATAIVMQWLVGAAAVLAKVDRLEVIAAVRDFVDRGDDATWNPWEHRSS